MLRYNLKHISVSGRKPLFWEPWGFGRWFLRVLLFVLCLGIFLLLFCIPADESAEPKPEPNQGPVVLHDGDVEITLKWSTADDLDLHCIGPDGENIYYAHRQSSSGGVLDHDMNVGGGQDGCEAVEHIYWPYHGAPCGSYKVSVVLFKRCSKSFKTDFSVRFKAECCTVPVDTTIYGTFGRSNKIEIGTFRVE